MTFKSLLAAGLTFAAPSRRPFRPSPEDATTTPAAVEQPATTPKPEQNWLKVCEPLADGKRACLMRQVIVTPNKQFMGSFVLRDDPGQQAD